MCSLVGTTTRRFISIHGSIALASRTSRSKAANSAAHYEILLLPLLMVYIACAQLIALKLSCNLYSVVHVASRQ
jgi:hypothetical protein